MSGPVSVINPTVVQVPSGLLLRAPPWVVKLAVPEAVHDVDLSFPRGFLDRSVGVILIVTGNASTHGEEVCLVDAGRVRDFLGDDLHAGLGTHCRSVAGADVATAGDGVKEQLSLIHADLPTLNEQERIIALSGHDHPHVHPVIEGSSAARVLGALIMLGPPGVCGGKELGDASLGLDLIYGGR
jgi:hypothetical protein